MSELEYVGLILEDQLLDHLATSDGAMAIWKERLNPEVIPEEEQGIREALIFVQRYIDEYREPPSATVLTDETGYDEFNEPEAPVAYVIERLRDRYRRKELKKVTTKIARLAGDPQAALDYGLEEMSRIRLQTQNVGTAITEQDFLSTLDDYYLERERGATGLSFGYEQVDDHLGGLRIGEVTVLLARPKRYKSWQMNKAAVGSYLNGKSVAVASLELSETETRNRIHCMLAGVGWNRFQHRNLTDVEIDKLTEAGEMMQEEENKLHIFRPKPGERTVSYLTSVAEDIGADLLVIDQLSWFDGAKDEGNWRVIGQVMEQLKDAAQKFPIYMAAQYNRQAVVEEGIADVSKAALSGFIEQTADHLLGIYASKDMLSNHLIHFGIGESRTFETVTWEVKAELTERSDFRCLGVLDD